ncbi:MAG: Ribose-phosphate pyrophosphokinase [Phycisphaerae bacterium]|nr:Ribose-phosphate pyrophosphokinase [Phycisphaerae bacterium]
MNGLKIFGGSSSQALAQKICRYLNLELGRANVSRFPDGETLVKLEDDVRGRDCFLVQSTCPPVNDNLLELLIFMDSLRRASARRITAVIPYFGYARQDRKAVGRTPITAKLVANMITAAGANRVLTMDLHADQIQGFFDIPLDHLTAVPVIVRYFKELNLNNFVTVSPDVGNMKTANAYSSRLGGDFAVLNKRRKTSDSIEMLNLIGEVDGRDVLIFDDMIATAGTICAAADFLRARGARTITIAATHPVFAGPAVQRMQNSQINRICVTDTIPLNSAAEQNLNQLTVLSIAELMGEAIRRIHRNESVSALFDSSDSSRNATA